MRYDIPATINGVSGVLETVLHLPNTTSPRPLVVVSHGAPRERHLCRITHPESYASPAEWFASQGYVAAVPMRRGYGTSMGEWAEGYGDCDDADFVQGGNASADDIEAAVNHLCRHPLVDPAAILLAGMSAGGWGSLALAARRSDITGVLNFAGGRGSLKIGENCSPDRLVEAAAVFGQTIQAPSLWLYAKNDMSFQPALARKMFAAFQAATRSRTRFVELPAYEDNGHRLFAMAKTRDLWTAHAQRFLAELDI